MHINRRSALLMAAGVALPATFIPATAKDSDSSGDLADDWDAVRALFELEPGKVHMSAMLLSSHPRPVHQAVERHRQELDANPVEYLERNNSRLTDAARQAAANYLGVNSSDIALTESTTAGVGLVYNGLRLRSDQELLMTAEDYFVTHESLRTAAARSHGSMRQIELYSNASKASVDEIVERIIGAIRKETRLIALTWVHSSTGLKMPASAIASALKAVNADRDEEDHVLFGLDAVHGFGVEDVDFAELGCDFYMAGCHKWLFGPRGTGIAAISQRGLRATRPVIPSFTDDGVFAAWLRDSERPPGRNDGERMSPGGFKAFEHRWALSDAFKLHQSIGRKRIADRTHQLAGQLKDELAKISGVTVHTPLSADVSSGIVSFDIEGRSPRNAVAALSRQGVIASVAPYATPHVRLTPSIYNSLEDIDRSVAAVRDL